MKNLSERSSDPDPGQEGLYIPDSNFTEREIHDAFLIVLKDYEVVQFRYLCGAMSIERDYSVYRPLRSISHRERFDVAYKALYDAQERRFLSFQGPPYRPIEVEPPNEMEIYLYAKAEVRLRTHRGGDLSRKLRRAGALRWVLRAWEHGLPNDVIRFVLKGSQMTAKDLVRNAKRNITIPQGERQAIERIILQVFREQMETSR